MSHPFSLNKTLIYLSIAIQYSWFFAWLHKRDDFPDVKIYVICPATEVHIRKVRLVHFFLVIHVDGHALVYKAGRAHGARDTRPLPVYRQTIHPRIRPCTHTMVFLVPVAAHRLTPSPGSRTSSQVLPKHPIS